MDECAMEGGRTEVVAVQSLFMFRHGMVVVYDRLFPGGRPCSAQLFFRLRECISRVNCYFGCHLHRCGHLHILLWSCMELHEMLASARRHLIITESWPAEHDLLIPPFKFSSRWRRERREWRENEIEYRTIERLFTREERNHMAQKRKLVRHPILCRCEADRGRQSVSSKSTC